MINERLPVELEPMRYAKSRRDIRGTLRLADMPRLREQLVGAQGSVDVRMVFDIDEHQFVVIAVSFKTKLPLQCQRSLEVFDFDVDGTSLLSPVYHESEAERLPAHYEPLVMADDTVSPLRIVEDELLLLLPLVPKKPLAEDGRKMHYETVETTTVERENPFDVLADLKLEK